MLRFARPTEDYAGNNAQRENFFVPCRSAACPFVVTMRERGEAHMIEFKPRFFVLPAIAVTVLAMLHAPADGGVRCKSNAVRQCRSPIPAFGQVSRPPHGASHKPRTRFAPCTRTTCAERTRPTEITAGETRCGSW